MSPAIDAHCQPPATAILGALMPPLPLSQAERVVDMLLQTKINVHIPDGKGRTPLHVSVWRGALNITRRLLGAGADPVSN